MGYPGSLDFSIFQIKLFLAVAEVQSFSRAAEAMHVEQSTLSRRIAILEQELGFSLFNRDSRPIQLTAKGAAIYDRWKPLVEAMEQSLAVVYAQRDESSETLSVCMMDSCNLSNDTPAISTLVREAHPELTLMFHYAPIYQWQSTLLEGMCDLAIVVAFDTAEMDSRFITDAIFEVPKLACMLRSNPLSAKEAITYDDLRDQRFITISEKRAPTHSAYIRRICNAHGFEPVFGSRSSNANGLTSALQNDNEVLICDQFLHGLDSPMLKTFELPDTWSGLCTVYLRDNANPYIQTFIELLRSYYP